MPAIFCAYTACLRIMHNLDKFHPSQKCCQGDTQGCLQCTPSRGDLVMTSSSSSEIKALGKWLVSSKVSTSNQDARCQAMKWHNVTIIIIVLLSSYSKSYGRLFVIENIISVLHLFPIRIDHFHKTQNLKNTNRYIINRSTVHF